MSQGGIVLMQALVAVTLLFPQLHGQAESREEHRRQLRKEAVEYMAREDCDLKVAVTKFQALIEDDPSHPENDEYLVLVASLLYNGDTYGGTPDPDAAIKVLNAVVEKYPPTRQSVITAKSMLGQCYLGTKQFKKARKAYEALLDIDTSGEEWASVREWSETTKAGCAQAYADSATVLGAPPLTLRNLAEMREKYRDRPYILKAIDAAEKTVKDQAALTVAGNGPRSDENGKVANGTSSSHPAASDILQTLTKIPKRKADLQGMGFDRVEVARASTDAVIHALVDAGVPVTFEDLGDGSVLDFSLSNASVDDVLREVTQRDDRYEAHKEPQGWSLLPKDSPLGKVSRRFEAHASSHVGVLSDIAGQLQESMGSRIPVRYASAGFGMPEESPVSISVDGKVYDALDKLIQGGDRWLWNVKWQIDGSVWLFLTPYPKHRMGRATSLTVVPDN